MQTSITFDTTKHLNYNLNRWIIEGCMHLMERGSSAVECRTRNLVSPGSLSCINKYLATDSGGHVSV